jgi:hypothetical protein
LIKFLIPTAILVSTVFLTTTVARGQTTCDSIATDIIKQFDSYSQKKFAKIKKKSGHDYETALTIFQIATYKRQKQDSAYREWYSLFIDFGKKMCLAGKDKGIKSDFLLLTAIAYFYTDNFEQANLYLTKATKANANLSCIKYYSEQTQAHLEKK